MKHTRFIYGGFFRTIFLVLRPAGPLSDPDGNLSLLIIIWKNTCIRVPPWTRVKKWSCVITRCTAGPWSGHANSDKSSQRILQKIDRRYRIRWAVLLVFRWYYLKILRAGAWYSVRVGNCFRWQNFLGQSNVYWRVNRFRWNLLANSSKIP